MNIQRKNSAHHFLMQSEREQTLVYHTQTHSCTEHHISSLHSHFRLKLGAGSPFLPRENNQEILAVIQHQYYSESAVSLAI